MSLNQVQTTYTDSSDSLWDFLTAWLPDTTWLKQLFLGLIGLILVIVVTYTLIRCAVSYVTRKYSLVD